LATLIGSGAKLSKEEIMDSFKVLNSLEKENIKTENEYKDYIRENFASEELVSGNSLTNKARDGFREMRDSIKDAKDELLQYRKELENTEVTATSMFEKFQKAGGYVFGGLVVNEVVNWAKTDAAISARDKTSFDLSSPIGMYTERKQFETFKETRERERLFHAIGAATGAVIGSVIPGLGTVAGAIGGGYFGGEMGTSIAGIFNSDVHAENEKELKILNQSYSTISGMVKATEGYDISKARLMAGYGKGVLGSLGLGYTPEQELAMRSVFGSSQGAFEEGLYKDQTTFSRAVGLDPSQIYQMNLSGRVTGADLSISGLNYAREYSTNLYGENVSPSRIIDVLNEIKKINEKQLSLNIDADSKNSVAFTQLPELIFGKDNPYGRLGDLGGESIKKLEGIMQPKSEAHEALLYQALGTDDLIKFTEAMKGGIYSGENFTKVLEEIKEQTAGDKNLSYFALNEMMPNTPQGFLPKITDLLNNDDKYNSFMRDWDLIQESMENVPQDEKDANWKKLIEKYELEGIDNISKTERENELIATIQTETAEKWRATILEADKKMAEFWNTMGTSAEYHEKIMGAQEKGFEFINQWRMRNKVFTRDEIQRGDILRNQSDGLTPGGMFSPHKESLREELLGESIKRFNDAVDKYESLIEKPQMIDVHLHVHDDRIDVANSNFVVKP